MRSIERLRKQALESCVWWGHNMAKFRYGLSFVSGSQNGLAFCKNPGCVAWVLIDAKPPANGIEISGTAVALNCPVKED